MRRFRIWLLIVIGLLIAVGLYRLRIEVDIFDLLPGDSLMAQGLRLYQSSFGASRELIISVRAPDSDTTTKAARSLAATIEKSFLSPRVIWQNPLTGRPEDLAELLAYYWFNQPPERFRELAGDLEGARLTQRLEDTKAQMATSYEPEKIARLSYDPLALSHLPFDTAASVLNSKGNPFASRTGEFRILLVEPPFEDAGFWTYRRWTKQVQQAVDKWMDHDPEFNSVTVRVTGTPAFIAQTGSGLLADMETSAIGTLLMVAALFWLVHRQWRPLIWLAALLVLILVLTIGLWGLFIGKLHAVSLGFGAILLGLAADYGLILYQEYLADSGRSIRALQAAVAPSIIWAAGTTSAAFLIIGRSSLPGMRQLGLLVGGGILLAAGIMMLLFLQPLAAKTSAVKKEKPSGVHKVPAWLMGPPIVWAITVVALGISVFVLYRSFPAADYSTRNLGPRQNTAREALEEVQRHIGGYHEGLWLIATGSDLGEVGNRLRQTALVLDEAVAQDLVKNYFLPVTLWPHPEFQTENREVAARLAADFPRIRQAVLDAGFTEASLKLSQMVISDWRRFVEQQGVVVPAQPGARWVFHQFTGEASGKRLALGRVNPAEAASKLQLLALARKIESETGSLLFGWSLLSESLMGLMQRDSLRVLLPIGIVVLILLCVAFQKPGEILLSIATIGFSVVCLLTVMVELGWSWNLMNLMALPLLFGAGVDYSIHIQFALRRFGGELTAVRQTVGNAILLCGASTACAFGSLAFASNTGVASLGRVCAVGILIICLSSVFLLPIWWKNLLGRRA